MAQLIELESLTNQSISARLGDHQYEIKLQTISDDLMCVSITRDNQVLIQGQRCMPFSPVLPTHLEKGLGNFMFTTVNGEYPYHSKFGGDHQLYFYVKSEMLELMSKAK